MSTKVTKSVKSVFNTPKINKHPIENTPTSSKNKSPKLIQLIEQKFARQTEIITAKIDEAVANAIGALENKLLELSNNLNNLTLRVNEMEKSQSCLNDLKTEINDLKFKICRQENLNVSCNLRLTGIPSYENENTFEIFKCLCDSLKIVTPSVISVHRIRNSNSNIIDGTILVKLCSPNDKNFILKTISKYRRENKTQLSIAMCGFDSNNHLFVNEDLTKENYKIYKTAIKYKKQKLLSAAFTLRGLVYVKQTEQDRGVRIDSLEHLNNFFR